MLLQQYRDDIIIALAEKTLSRDYALMRHDEENLPRQKARLLNLGDSNLGFFFKAVKNFHGNLFFFFKSHSKQGIEKDTSHYRQQNQTAGSTSTITISYKSWKTVLKG